MAQSQSNIKAVCLALGPYRNLTTLTAATLFLHPNCQVLNHAGARIFDTNCDFLSAYSPEVMDRFIHYSIEMSREGQRGSYGGSITLSHAFDEPHPVRGLFKTAGLPMVKSDIVSLFWKESHQTSNLIRDKSIDIAGLLSRERRLRFLMPIRNPLDCARSTISCGYYYLFKGLTAQSSFMEVVRAILDEIHWFMALRVSFPDRVFYFFEYAISPEMLRDLATFMSLPMDDQWLAVATKAMVSNKHYAHDASIIEMYVADVVKKFQYFPEISKGLLMFAGR